MTKRSCPYCHGALTFEEDGMANDGTPSDPWVECAACGAEWLPDGTALFPPDGVTDAAFMNLPERVDVPPAVP